MAAIRLNKEDAASATPYFWNAPAAARTTARASAHPDSNHEKELQERYQRGYRDGEISGKAAKADAAIEALTETIVDLSRTRATLFRSAQGDLLRLAIAVARRILHREVLMSADVLGGVISVALGRIEESDLHSLRVHPSLIDRIKEYLSNHTSGCRLEVVGDSSLPLGGCVFETQHGSVDAGIESQLSEIERGLADHLEALR